MIRFADVRWGPVDFAGGGLEDARAYALGESEHVDGAVHAGLGGLHGVVLVVDGRGGAGVVVDFIHLSIEREGHIVPLQFKMRMIQQIRDVGAATGEKIIHAQHFVPGINQSFAQVRAEKSSTAGD